MTLDELFNQYLPPLEAEMKAVVQGADPHHAALYGMLRYHLGWADADFAPQRAASGKRIRPVLCLLACQASGGEWARALPAAAAIELLHNFSLIHDDIEDEDCTRRGRPTVWTVWGKAQGINTGDALFTLAQLALLRLPQRGLLPAFALDAARCFNQTCLRLTEGQHMDIGFEERAQVPVDKYLAMIEGKTAALVACACEMGALVAEADVQRRAHLRAFGRHLGLAFQMEDDVLGIWGDPARTGKPAGADIARRKKTLPLLHGLERSEALRALLARETLSSADVQRATALLTETGSRTYTEALAREHHGRAMAALDEARLSGPAARALRELAERLLGRDR
jgi:geranylgeranyl diphosphate synthase type I